MKGGNTGTHGIIEYWNDGKMEEWEKPGESHSQI
jgi:hypothetical protein